MRLNTCLFTPLIQERYSLPSLPALWDACDTPRAGHPGVSGQRPCLSKGNASWGVSPRGEISSAAHSQPPCFLLDFQCKAHTEAHLHTLFAMFTVIPVVDHSAKGGGDLWSVHGPPLLISPHPLPCPSCWRPPFQWLTCALEWGVGFVCCVAVAVFSTYISGVTRPLVVFVLLFSRSFAVASYAHTSMFSESTSSLLLRNGSR